MQPAFIAPPLLAPPAVDNELAYANAVIAGGMAAIQQANIAYLALVPAPGYPELSKIVGLVMRAN